MTTTSGRLEGKVALVTGSTSGLGRAIATTFAREGAAVVVTGRNEDRGRAVTAEIIAAGGRAVCIPADIADESAVESLIGGTVDAFGALHVLVNNAAPLDQIASGGARPITEADMAILESIFRVTLFGAVFAVKHAIPPMRAVGGGNIINISSTASITGEPAQPGYMMAKAGMNALTINTAYDYGPTIRSNAILVGMMNSGSGTRTKDFNADPEWRARQMAMHVTRPAEVDDIAQLATFLAADAGFMTGSLIVADGGAAIKRNVAQIPGRWYPAHVQPIQPND